MQRSLTAARAALLDFPGHLTSDINRRLRLLSAERPPDA